MATNKTTQNELSVADFLNSLTDEGRKKDSFALLKIIAEVTGHQPKMWGSAIVGFGQYHYKYESGHEGDAPLAGFSPRKDKFAIYLSTTYNNKEELLLKLGRHKTGKACLYIKALKDINVDVLKVMIKNSAAMISDIYP